MIKITLKGGEEVKTFAIKFSDRMTRVGPAITNMVGKRIQKSAKLRAPRWTGQLARGIKVVKTGRNTLRITSDVPYSAAQETGYEPHFVNILAHPELLQWQKDKYGGIDRGAAKYAVGVKGAFFVRHFTPHIAPALEKVRVDLPKIFKEAIAESKERKRYLISW
jgi:hypothetical protein